MCKIYIKYIIYGLPMMQCNLFYMTVAFWSRWVQFCPRYPKFPLRKSFSKGGQLQNDTKPKKRVTFLTLESFDALKFNSQWLYIKWK